MYNDMKFMFSYKNRELEIYESRNIILIMSVSK